LVEKLILRFTKKSFNQIEQITNSLNPYYNIIKMRSLFFLFPVLMLFSCGSDKESVDLLVTNAVIYTVDDNFSKAEAMAIRDGRIVEVGSTEDLQKKYHATENYDAGGKTIVPGLIDAHAHLYGLGLSLQQVDLNGTKSFDELLERVVKFTKEHNPEYITGRGWDQNHWPGKEFPTKERLDSLFPDIPVALRRVDGHALFVNSKALELAGITAETKIKGGEVILENGVPTGVLIDNAMEPVNATIPQPDEKISTQALLDAQKVAFSFGLTTVDDAGLDREVIELIDKLHEDGKLKLRIYAMVSNTPENLDYYLSREPYKTDWLNVRSFKIYTDGALGSRGAAMRESYSDRHNHFGLMITPAEALEEVAKRISATEYQMNSHAIGDSATISVLRTYEQFLKDKKDRRWRVEHAQIISPEGFDYFKKDHNILPSVQPTHATSDMYWAEGRIGAERMKGAYSYKTLREKSGMVALGTDFPVEHVNPMYTFYAAVVRKDLKHWPEGGFQMKDALSREEALRGMTIWAAFSNFEENEKGSLESGKFADFVILDKDLMTADENELPNIKVLGTFVGGEKVF